jgi:hypothetical protein
MSRTWQAFGRSARRFTSVAPEAAAQFTAARAERGPLRHPIASSLSLAGVRLIVESDRAMGFPVLHWSSSCTHAVATTPAEPLGAFFAHFPSDNSLPRLSRGSASALHFSRIAQRSLTLRPAYSPSPLRALFTEGFSRFVTSATAPIATGWSDSRRVGFARTERPCLCTAHRERRDNLMEAESPPFLSWPSNADSGDSAATAGACN